MSAGTPTEKKERKVAIYNVPAYVELFSVDKAAGTDQIFAGMCTGAYELKQKHWFLPT
jgi:hypothetical protein